MPTAPARRAALAATAALITLTLALTGCSGSSSDKPSKSATPTTIPSIGAACVPSGSASEAVQVTGDFETSPNVAFNAPLKLSTTQRTVVIQGSGDPAAPGSVVKVNFTLYNGTTGQTINGTEYGADKAAPIPVDASQTKIGIAKTLNCARPGERVVGVIPASEAFGAGGSSSLGIGANQVIVIIADVVSIVPTKASGDVVAPPAGAPTVTRAADGTPTLHVPDGYKPPATTQIITLIKGAGAVVGPTDQVTLQHQGTNLATGKVFDTTWGTAPSPSAVNGFIPGFMNAIVGQTVGSQVLVIVAPADGYGPEGGQSSAGIGKSDTIVFVIDILDAQSSTQ